MKEENMSDFTLGTFGWSVQTGQIFFLALETYTTFFNEGIDKQKTKNKKKKEYPHDYYYHNYIWFIFAKWQNGYKQRHDSYHALKWLPIHTISCHTKNSTKPAGLYLSSKSMSFILIKSHFVLTLRYNYWRNTVLFARGSKWKKSLTLISVQLDHAR